LKENLGVSVYNKASENFWIGAAADGSGAATLALIWATLWH